MFRSFQMRQSRFLILLVLLAMASIQARAQTSPTAVPGELGDYPVVPVPFHHVKVEGGFWGPRFETNRRVTIPYDFARCEETGRIDNFSKAGGLIEGAFRGIRYDDSDVFKVIEGAAYSLATHPDPQLEAYLDDLIAKIAAAQEPDGYLFTCRTIDPENLPRDVGAERWSFLAQSHELYNVGHMYEAAVAHYLVTGKRSLLDVALKNADLVARTFGPGEGQLRDVPGHQEIEIGLIRLYRVTGERKYFDLAKFFLDERGRSGTDDPGSIYRQAHKPILEQEAAVGHAVRAIYMYTAMADVAAMTGDADYRAALDRLWQDVAGGKTYITGGVGSQRGGEAFGDPYQLPNASAYNETCAAIASAMWNHRMFLLTGEGRYLDVLERVIYNGFLSGVSLEGNSFFYPNPLAHDGRTSFNHGRAGRSPWFGTSCCPVNVARFVPSIAGYIYAALPEGEGGGQLFVNLFIQGSARVELGGQVVTLEQETHYPYDGNIRLRVDPEQAGEFTLNLRIPGWARGEPAPTDLYRYVGNEPAGEMFRLTVNGEEIDAPVQNGFARITRSWAAGDEVRLELPMSVRRVVAHESVAADRGRVVLERGPIVYCLEGVDHADGRVAGLILPDEARVSVEPRPDLLGGVTVLTADGLERTRNDDGEVVEPPATLTFIPYYAWAHREMEGRAPAMAVWVARTPEAAEIPPAPTIASRSAVSASHVYGGDSLTAVNDQVIPGPDRHPGEHDIPRFTWWPRQGTDEWIQLDLAEPATVSAVEVWWYDDTGRGQCRPPVSWQLLYRTGGEWKPLPAEAYPAEKGGFSRVTFEPVEAEALRIEARLQPGFSSGLLEWSVE